MGTPGSKVLSAINEAAFGFPGSKEDNLNDMEMWGPQALPGNLQSLVMFGHCLESRRGALVFLVSASLSLSVCLSLSLTLFLPLSVSLSLSLPLSLCIGLSLSPVFASLCACLSVSVSLCLSYVRCGLLRRRVGPRAGRLACGRAGTRRAPFFLVCVCVCLCVCVCVQEDFSQ